MPNVPKVMAWPPGAAARRGSGAARRRARASKPSLSRALISPAKTRNRKRGRERGWRARPRAAAPEHAPAPSGGGAIGGCGGGALCGPLGGGGACSGGGGGGGAAPRCCSPGGGTSGGASRRAASPCGGGTRGAPAAEAAREAAADAATQRVVCVASAMPSAPARALAARARRALHGAGIRSRRRRTCSQIRAAGARRRASASGAGRRAGAAAARRGGCAAVHGCSSITGGALRLSTHQRSGASKWRLKSMRLRKDQPVREGKKVGGARGARGRDSGVSLPLTRQQHCVFSFHSAA
jgi:hypothetical protein